MQNNFDHLKIIQSLIMFMMVEKISIKTHDINSINYKYRYMLYNQAEKLVFYYTSLIEFIAKILTSEFLIPIIFMTFSFDINYVFYFHGALNLSVIIIFSKSAPSHLRLWMF